MVDSVIWNMIILLGRVNKLRSLPWVSSSSLKHAAYLSFSMSSARSSGDQDRGAATEHAPKDPERDGHVVIPAAVGRGEQRELH